MSLHLTNHLVEGVTVIDISGRITLADGSVDLREVLRDLAAKGVRRVLVNMSDVTYVDSSGIGELASGYTTMTNAGGSMKMYGVTKRVKDLLLITRLYGLFDVQDSESAAIRSF